ncbi:MAG: VWA domain-containing protein [Flavobacteriaceae bacterium]|nr:VWA domain-containing protein [Flavobacteriaceae bacterium]
MKNLFLKKTNKQLQEQRTPFLKKGVMLLFSILMSITGLQAHTPDTPVQTIKVALLLDTSNSMDGLINQAKTQLWEIVNELSYAKASGERPDLKIALYEYGNDGIESNDGYIRQVLDFSSDLDEISEKLFSLSTNGGSEYCGQVIQKSLQELHWKKGHKNDLNIIFIAGNERFTQGHISYKTASKNALKQEVIVNTIFCGNYENGVQGKWKEGALLAGGEYLTIDHNKTIVHLSTPYDVLILRFNKQLNETYIGYGSEGVRKLRMQYVQDKNACSLDEVVEVKRAISKSSNLYKNSSWDLVDAQKEAHFSYEKLDKKTLPKELLGKTTQEIKAYVALKSKERQSIQQKIKDLDRKRRNYIREKTKNSVENDLQTALIRCIKAQAKKQGYTFK